MTYLISTDKVITEHIAKSLNGEAVAHALPFHWEAPIIGYVTSCDSAKRVLTLQTDGGKKHTLTFDHILIPKE